MAEVSRPRQAGSKIAGPIEAPKQDILFNASKRIMVPPGIAGRTMQHIKQDVTYERRGGLYVDDLELSDFGRQGASAQGRQTPISAAFP